MIKLQKSTFYNEADTKLKLCDFIMQANQLSMGSECKKFEENFSRKQERKFSVFVNSGSSANLILIQSLMNLSELQIGSRVGVSSLTWATNIMPLIQLGLVPVLIDCEISSLNISLDTFKNAIKKAGVIDALFITNTLGLCGNIEEISKYCVQNKIILLEDNCESLGSRVNGKLLGNFGKASTFSTFVGHHLSTIEGGVVCTDDEALHASLLMTRSHGWDRSLSSLQQSELRKEYEVSEFYSKYTFYDLAYNLRPTEIAGFIGNTQIGYWDEIVAKREHNFKLLNDSIMCNPDLIAINATHMDLVSSFAIPIIARDRDIFEAYKLKFIDAGVEVRPMIAGDMSSQPFYKKYVSSKSHLPNSEFIHRNSFYCGNNPELTLEELTCLLDLVS